MAINVNISRLAGVVRNAMDTTGAARSTSQSKPTPSIQTTVAKDSTVSANEREFLEKFWIYLELTYGMRPEEVLSRPNFDLEGEMNAMVNKGEALLELAEALDALGGAERLDEARASSISKNLDGLAEELSDLLETLRLGNEDAPLTHLVEQLQTMLADPPEDAPTPAKIALLSAWMEEAHTMRPPTPRELEGFLVMPRIFKMLNDYKGDTSGRAFRNRAAHNVTERMFAGIFDTGSPLNDYSDFRSYPDAETATRELNLDGGGISAEWSMDWSEVAVKHSLDDVRVKVNYELEHMHDHGEPIAERLEKIASGAISSDLEPWHAAAMKQVLSEGASSATRGDLDCFVVQAKVRQEYMGPENFSMPFADGFRDVTMRVHDNISAGLLDLAKHAETKSES